VIFNKCLVFLAHAYVYIKADGKPQTKKMDDDDVGRWHFIVNFETRATESREIERLMDAGVDPNLTHGQTGQNYVQLTCSRAFRFLQIEYMIEIFEFFLNRPNFNVNHIDGHGLALIHYCVSMGDPIFLEMLLSIRKRDVNINVVVDTTLWPGNDEFTSSYYNGYTALNMLMEAGEDVHHRTKLQLLLDNGADPKILDQEGYGPIQKLIQYSYRFNNDEFTENIRLLLDNGADPNILDKEGYGPIHNLIRSAVRFTHDEFAENIRLLLAPRVSPTAAMIMNARGDPNLRTRATGFTPLHVALNMRCPKYVFDALLRGGTDVCLRDNDGRTPL